MYEFEGTRRNLSKQHAQSKQKLTYLHYQLRYINARHGVSKEQVMHRRHASTSPSSGYFSINLTDLRELHHYHSPCTLLLISRRSDQNKSGCGRRDMRTLVDISPLLKPSERYLAAQVACDAV